MKTTIEIQNCPPTPNRYIVARPTDGALWYWGSWDTEEPAATTAQDLNALLIDTGEPTP